MSTVDDLRAFIHDHRGCGALVGDAEALSASGYLLWIDCACGVRFERWVTPEEAQRDLVFSDLSALRN